MSTATTVIQEPDRIDAFEADAQAKIAELEQQEARLSLDAINDPAMAQELADVRSERTSAESAVRQAALARKQLEQLEQQAADEADTKRIAAARAEAEKLGRQLADEAESVDVAAAAYARAVADYGRTFQQRREAQQAAGDRPWGQGGRPLGLGAALRFHLIGADALAFVDVRDGCPDRPLTAEVNR